MCGVIGVTIRDFKERDYDLVRNLFIQSMIRGKHATGVSYLKDNEIHTFKESIPAKEFIEKQKIDSWVNEDGNLYCVGHVRYSTSDLRYNQPFSNENLSIVHNGVISQESPDTWFDSYDIKTETANDSELILHAMDMGKNVFEYFHPSSMAVCALTVDKKIIAFRNEARPLYFYQDDRMTLFTSTKNIAQRAGVNNSVKTKQYRKYIVEDFKMSYIDTTTKTSIKDLQ